MMQTAQRNLPEARQAANAINTFTFFKEEGRWYIHLPKYLETGWSKKDLEMVAGAHRLLNAIARGCKKISMRMCTEPFHGADVLELIELCDVAKGGGMYLMRSCHGRQTNARMWICDMPLFAFGNMPQRIYVQRVERKRRTAEC